MFSKILNKLSDSVHQEFIFDRPGGKYEISHYCLLAALALVAYYLRIMNLGVPGLSGDEDIMGLAVRGLHESGQPVLPSGMEYRRAIVHTYLIYYSTQLFGQTEWALRIPSVIAGMLLLVFVFRIGKRFLVPMHNVAAFSLFALAPPLIEISRTARMYVFLVLALAVFIYLVFKWERQNNWLNPIAALSVLALAATFHSLAIFALPVVFWPALSTGSPRHLRTAITACLAFLVFYWAFGNWAGAPYPTPEQRPVYVEAINPLAAYSNDGALNGLRWAFIAVSAVWIAWMARGHVSILKNLRVAMLAGGLALVMCRYYLPGAYLILFGALWRRRIDEIFDRPLAVICGLSLIVFGIDLLNSIAQAGINRVALRLTFEEASPYLWIRAVEAFPLPVLITSLVTPLLLIRSKKDTKSPGFALLIIFALMVPMFAMSTFRWDFEHRYMFAFLPLLLILTAAVLQELASVYFPQMTIIRRRFGASISAILIILTMNPKALYQYAVGDTSELPAHKATALFVAATPGFNRAVIIAEDAIATHYYLGRLNYKLQYGPKAAAHAWVREGRIEDQYTGAEIIGSGPELRNVLCASEGVVYIIGDGQASKSGRKRNRDGGIEHILDGPLVTVEYQMLPGPATVWRYEGPCQTSKGSELDPLGS